MSLAVLIQVRQAWFRGIPSSRGTQWSTGMAEVL